MKTLKIIVIFLIISACSVKDGENEVPIRVKDIPENAFWIGGVDGGNWFLVDDVHPHKNNATIKVYSDNDGSLITSKRFMLICPTDNQIFIDDLKEQINSFDGERILLKSINGKKACFLQ